MLKAVNKTSMVPAFWSFWCNRREGQRRVNYTSETWVQRSMWGLSFSQQRKPTKSGQMVHLYLLNHILEYFVEHKSSLENMNLLIQHFFWIFGVKVLNRHLGYSRLDISWRWCQNICKFNVKNSDSLPRIVYFILPNDLGIPSGKESGKFFSPQDISSGKYLRILNMTNDLLVLYLRGNRVLPEQEHKHVHLSVSSQSIFIFQILGSL